MDLLDWIAGTLLAIFLTTLTITVLTSAPEPTHIASGVDDDGSDDEDGC